MQQTIECVLGGHLDGQSGADLEMSVLMLRGYLTTMADQAEGDLDTGRAVFRETLRRAHRLAAEKYVPSALAARRLAQTIRDLLILLRFEGWHDLPHEAAS
ncbi:DUF6415 family natural product biosynthesis protein [Streptomyces nigrescens]